MNSTKVVSTGGVGDSFIVFLKLIEKLKEDRNLTIDWTHIESNEKSIELINDWFYNSFFRDFSFDPITGERAIRLFAITDEAYSPQKVMRDYLGTHEIFNAHILGQCKFYGFNNNQAVKTPFINLPQKKAGYTYDLCIQVSAGANSSRSWNFDPRQLKRLLENKGLKVALVGSSDNFFNPEDKDNYVKKCPIHESISVISSSRVYVGLSGFHTYWSLACGIKNIHQQESEDHNRAYIHPKWNKNRFPVKNYSMQEVISGLRHWGIKI